MQKPFNSNFLITQTFGNKLIINGVDIYAQWGYKGHNGIDYGTPSGTPIVAPHSGRVIESAYDSSGYGNYVKIENDVEGSVLAHFSSREVTAGQEVKEGNIIGLSGNTGNSTGPHLHWGYYRHPRNRQNGYGGFIDQTPYIGINSSTPNMDSKKAIQFDRVLNYLKEKGYIADNDSNKYLDGEFLDLIKKLYEDLRNNRKRAGKWDSICLKAGITTDSNKVTVDQIYEKLYKAEVVSTQSEQLLNLRKENEALNKNLEEAKKLVEQKEALRAKWYSLYETAKDNFDTCKQGNATLQKKLTECQNKQDFTVGELVVRLWNKVRGVKI